jgi:hypothetical protein
MLWDMHKLPKALLVVSVAIAVIAMAGCSKSKDSSSSTSDQSDNTDSAQLTNPIELLVESSAIVEGQVQIQYGCKALGGQNFTPEVIWSGTPPETTWQAVIMYDVDSPGATPFVHWALTDIEPTVAAVPAGPSDVGVALPNTTGSTEYFGPCPPDDATHTYVLAVYAFDDSVARPTTGEELLGLAVSSLSTGSVEGTFPPR